MLPILVIPALNPDEKLLHLWETYQHHTPDAVSIVVNDGSTQGLMIFEALAKQGCIVLHHSRNQGKGVALKTAIRYFLDHYATTHPGIITADADGQHTLLDILRVREAFMATPLQLHLGVRDWQQHSIPWRNKIGNKITRWLFNAMMYEKIKDTQTGLRALPKHLLAVLLKTKTSRFEFEFEMFFIAKKQGISIQQTPIQTLYLDDNKQSHFHPLWDSLRIYFIFIRFSLVALLSFLLDFTLFSCIYWLSGHAGWAILVARCISSPFNFILNKMHAFRSDGQWLVEAMAYFSLVCIAGYLVFECMLILYTLGLNMYWSKMIAESAVFLINFFVQHKLIFTQHHHVSRHATPSQ